MSSVGINIQFLYAYKKTNESSNERIKGSTNFKGVKLAGNHTIGPE